MRKVITAFRRNPFGLVVVGRTEELEGEEVRVFFVGGPKLIGDPGQERSNTLYGYGLDEFGGGLAEVLGGEVGGITSSQKSSGIDIPSSVSAPRDRGLRVGEGVSGHIDVLRLVNSADNCWLEEVCLLIMHLFASKGG